MLVPFEVNDPEQFDPDFEKFPAKMLFLIETFELV